MALHVLPERVALQHGRLVRGASVLVLQPLIHEEPDSWQPEWLTERAQRC